MGKYVIISVVILLFLMRSQSAPIEENVMKLDQNLDLETEEALLDKQMTHPAETSVDKKTDRQENFNNITPPSLFLPELQVDIIPPQTFIVFAPKVCPVGEALTAKQECRRKLE